MEQPRIAVIENPEKGTKSKMESTETETKEKKKKKKWKAMPLTDVGFNTSLFHRPTRPELIDPVDEVKIIEQIERELDEYDSVVDRYQDCDTTNTVLFEGNCKKTDKLARADRDRKIRKAGKQVKNKYCTSVKNNHGRKKLYIHHRLHKLITLEVRRVSCYLPSQSTYNYSIHNKNSDEIRSRLKTNNRTAPVQNLRFALQNTNAATHLQTDLLNGLINLQHRELTPEDYELLLRLDESVAPKTIDKSVLNLFKTDSVTDNAAGDMCPVCMEPYEIGQNRKCLPCNHVFHSKCIDMWLENSSRNCPIDGLPVDEAS